MATLTIKLRLRDRHSTELAKKTVQYTAPDCGMALRDWFAGQALNGMMANGYMPRPVRTLSTSTFDATHYDYAGKAYELADAMLKARQP